MTDFIGTVMSGFVVLLLIVLIIYFVFTNGPFLLVIAGFVALACMWAVAGALASRSEDLQSTTTPLTMILVMAFVVGLSVQGAAKAVASFVPILSAITMPGRVVTGEASWWEPVVALVLTLAFAAATILVGERIYRRSLLQTRGRVSLRAAWRSTD